MMEDELVVYVKVLGSREILKYLQTSNRAGETVQQSRRYLPVSDNLSSVSRTHVSKRK